MDFELNNRPPRRQQENRNQHVGADAHRAHLAQAGHARIAGTAQRTKPGHGRAAAQHQRPPDGTPDRAEIAAMPAQRQLDENGVVHARAQHQRQGHQVHQVPRPAAQRHDGQQAQSAQAQHRHAQQDFRRPAEREPERKQHQHNHRRHHLPHSGLHALQRRAARAIPNRKAARRLSPDVVDKSASAAASTRLVAG